VGGAAEAGCGGYVGEAQGVTRHVTRACFPLPLAGEGAEPRSGEAGEGENGMREGQKREFARTLRRNATDAERSLWRLLRDRRLGDAKFRRQVPIGPFITDFASVTHRIVIELDGGQHAESRADATRDAFLAAAGWRVLRFWNNDLTQHRDGVLGRILAVVEEARTIALTRLGACAPRHPLP
jgi:very-short-patch-repair endonuclease